MSDKLFKTLAYLGGAAAIYSGFRRKKKAERNRIIAQQATMRAQQAAFSATQTNEQMGPTQVSNADPSQGSGSQTGASVNTSITGTGSYQITADTNASLPLLYGQCQVRGSVVGSELEGIGNSFLRTAFVLAETVGEYPDVGDYTVNRVFWNDVSLNVTANGAVRGATLNDGTSTTKYDGLIDIAFYQGDFYTPFANVMGSVPDYSGKIKPGIPKWHNNSADYYGRGALWAFVDVRYDAEAGVQGLGTFTFDITNQDYSNPANVIYDYLTVGRYGHGYPSSAVDSGSFFSGANSLRNISDELRFFTSEDADDDANVDITNATIAPQFVTTGNSFQTLNIANSDVLGTISANTANVGTTDTGSLSPVASETYNRLKILWAYDGIDSNVGGVGSGDIANCNTSLTTNSTFTAMLDVARLIPDGVGYTDANADPDVLAGNINPGVTYNYGDATGTVEVLLANNSSTPIIGFLKEGDKIRPEGSPYIYTVAEDVDVPNPGYNAFTIPVKERIHQLDIANTDLANLTTNAPGSNSGVYSTLISGDDIKGIYQFGSWPYFNAPSIYSQRYGDALFSNVLIGNAAMSSPQEDTLYLGQEKKAEINGLLSTEGDVQSNLRTLLQHSDATITWDLTQGKWKVLPNANAETANAFVFNDDNIIGEIRVTTSDISNFYNSARASYVEKTHNSVKEEIIIYTPDSEKATNETPHKLEMNYPLCSSGTEATRKIEQVLIQNRLDLVTEFSADYSSIVVEPGDIVKLTNEDYGFSEKLFRVLKKTQQMDDDILTCRFILLEWDLAIFKERIGFKKPALDDIEFDPEQYDDKTDGEALRDDSVPPDSLQDGIDGGKIANGSITGDQIGNNTVGSDNLTNVGNPGFITPNLSGNIIQIPYNTFGTDGRQTGLFSANINLGGLPAPVMQYVHEGNLSPTTFGLQDLGNSTFSINSADIGDYLITTQFNFTSEWPLDANNLLDGNLIRKAKIEYELYYGGNSTVIDTGTNDAVGGSNLNQKIDYLYDLNPALFLTIPFDKLGAQIDYDSGNVILRIGTEGYQYFTGTAVPSAQYSAQAIFAVNGPLRNPNFVT